MNTKFATTSLVVCILSTCFLLSTCSKEHGGVNTMGEVTNAITGEPIENIQIKIETDRCGLIAFDNCDPINKSVLTGPDGTFDLRYIQDCDHEFIVRIPEQTKKDYPNAHIEIVDKRGNNPQLSCHDNILLALGKTYDFDITIHPQVTVMLKPIQVVDLDLAKVSFPDFEIESSTVLKEGSSFVFKIDDYKGVIRLKVEYENALDRMIEIPFDYSEEQLELIHVPI